MRYVFAGYELDTHLYSLQRAGQSISLRPKVFQVLLHLLEHRDRVVTKHELLEAVWPEQYISDATLADCIRSIRRALGETRASQQIIQTRHGHGYRLIAEVLVAAPEGQETAEPQAVPVPEALPSASPVAMHSTAEPTPVSSYVGTTRQASELSELPVTTPLASSQTPLMPTTTAERRQITVMSCALLDTSPQGGTLDPEDWHEIIQAWQESCRGAIEPLQGHIAHDFGDALLVYFGYPQAHEDDARRAILAALELLAALEALRARLAHLSEPGLAVRIGIHTGLVVTGMMENRLRPAQFTTGATPHIVASIQAQAQPNTLVMSHTTARLVQGYVVCREVGSYPLPGLATPIQLWQVLASTEAQNRLESVARERLTPLVGREAEMTLLRERWRRAQEGEGQVVLLSGEAGIGKSRLVLALKEQALQEGAMPIAFQCSPYQQQSAFAPVVEHLQRLLRFSRDASPQARLATLQQLLTKYHFSQEDTVPLLAALLSLPQPDGASPLSMSPQQRKEKLQDTLIAWIIEEAEHQVVYCVWEDLHWADPSTLECLQRFLEQVPIARIFVILTSRPDFTPSWGPQAYIGQITLSRLHRTQTEAMIQQLAGGKMLPPEVVTQVVTKTDGVPLFVEEYTRMLLESGFLLEVEQHYECTTTFLPSIVPTTLQDLLVARLDRLAKVKDIAQLGAALGREFTYELLRAVAPWAEETLQQGLLQLVKAEILYQRGHPPQTRYSFKHALLQDAAYQSLLRRQRRQLHQRIAQTLAGQFAETCETTPELVAYHYTEAGLAAEALPYWQQAGQRAIERSANTEAIQHLTQALALMTDLPETPERAERELALQVLRAVPMTLTMGWAAPDVGMAYQRAQALTQQVGPTPHLFPTLVGLATYYIVRADFEQACRMVQRNFAVAEASGDVELLLEAHHDLCTTAFYVGRFADCTQHGRQVVALYDAETYRHHAFVYGKDPCAVALMHAGFATWFLGYPDQALQLERQALALTEHLPHPFTNAWALSSNAFVHHFRREGLPMQSRAQALIAAAREQGFPQWLAQGLMYHGWTLAVQGKTAEGIVQIRQGLEAWRATGSQLVLTYFLGLLAEALLMSGALDAALATVDEALEQSFKTGEVFWRAELYRIRGAIRLQGHMDGEPDVLRALALAREQGARALELRSAMTLGRLWQTQKRGEAAGQLVESVYQTFSEGFDTPELSEARTFFTN